VENRVASLVIDATDAVLLARFWAGALGWQIIKRGSYGVSIGTTAGHSRSTSGPCPTGPRWRRTGCTLISSLSHRDQAAELDRLLGLGARQADVGQGARSWHVLADPEGNEFCLCRP
jgi:predicted enzyme related to lactoylglutathione lyase